MERSVCVISFSLVHRDARVLRQVDYLSRSFRVVVIGLGPPHPVLGDRHNVEWHTITPATDRPSAASGSGEGYPRKLWRSVVPFAVRERISMMRQRMRRAPLTFRHKVVARVRPEILEAYYWQMPGTREALELAVEARCASIHANDWEALPVSVQAARRTGAGVVFDAHEFSPRQFTDDADWRRIKQPVVTYVFAQYLPSVDRCIAVSPHMARALQHEYNMHPTVVLNAPERGVRRARTRDSHRIRLIHHGGAVRNRELERMILVFAATDPRFTLDLMLLGDDAYIQELQRFTAARAPMRIRFVHPVTPEAIVDQLAGYDMGIYLLPGRTFNHRIALPNKFFDFICAGLGVCVGPTGPMAEIVRDYGCGVITPSYEPQDVATALNALCLEDIQRMQDAAWKVSSRFNASREMSKVVELHDEVVAGTGADGRG